MARTHARLTTAGLSEPDWQALGLGPQWLYVALLRQPKLSIVGHLDVMPNRWVTAEGVTVADVRTWLERLRSNGFVVVDEATDELIIRTFTTHDLKPGRMSEPVVKGVWNAWSTIMSTTLRELIVTGMPDEVWAKVEKHAPDQARQIRRSSPFERQSPSPLETETASPFECPISYPLSPATTLISQTTSTGGDPPPPLDDENQVPEPDPEPTPEPPPEPAPPKLTERELDQATNKAVGIYAQRKTATATGVVDPGAFAAGCGKKAAQNGTRDRIRAAIAAGATPEEAAAKVITEQPTDPLAGILGVASRPADDPEAIQAAALAAKHREEATKAALAEIAGQPRDDDAGRRTIAQIRAENNLRDTA